MSNQLESFSVRGLFGLYSHEIDLNTSRHISVIIGPNGRGKTVCLKLIDAIFKRNYGYFLEIPFDEITYKFSSSAQIRVIPTHFTEDSEDLEFARRIVIEIVSSEGVVQNWRPAAFSRGDPRLRRIGQYLPFLELIGPDEWIDNRDGEELTFREIIDRYGDQLPRRIREFVDANEPQEFQEIVDSIRCSLIETQRLLVLADEMGRQEYIHPGYRRHHAGTSSRYAVDEKAGELQQIIRGTLARYATLSQSLDRTFPRRVLEGGTLFPLTPLEIRTQLEALDGKRQELMRAGILDEELEPFQLRFDAIDEGVAQLLNVYSADTSKKLTVFDELLEKIKAFSEIVNDRFIDKRLVVDREHGFAVISNTDQLIPLEKLSSGEQHQLILAYDLLFEVQENSLILIDEPELSLHVSWQKTFIDGLERMISLNTFDVLIATHSPPLVAEHFDLTTELGNVEEPQH